MKSEHFMAEWLHELLVVTQNVYNIVQTGYTWEDQYIDHTVLNTGLFNMYASGVYSAWMF